MRLKIGDKVKVMSEHVEEDKHLIGMVGVIKSFQEYNTVYVDFGESIIQHNNVIDETTHIFFQKELELFKRGIITKETPDDLVRYMVYGTGCDNKGNLLKTEKELKEDLKVKTKDSSWTGRIIGYKLEPLYEAELTTKLKVFPKVKITKNIKNTTNNKK